MIRLRLPPVMLAGFLTILFAGCSVKEDRVACPCALMLDFSGIDRDRLDSLDLCVTTPDGFLHSDIIRSASFTSPHRVDVPKGEFRVNVYAADYGRDALIGMVSDVGNAMAIPYGQDCPEVNTFSVHAVAFGETVTVPVVLHKNYCSMSITVIHDEDMDLGIALLGDVCGYDMDGIPAEGDFLYEPKAGGGDTFRARIPRQTDSSLKLDISDGGRLLQEFTIGELIIESGYDWSAEDLEDVAVRIDVRETGISVRVNDWTTVVGPEIVM